MYTRARLARRIALAGVGCSVPGFAARVVTECQRVCERDESLRGLANFIHVIERPFVPAIAAWVGGAVLAGAGRLRGVEGVVLVDGEVYRSGRRGIGDPNGISPVRVFGNGELPK